MANFLVALTTGLCLLFSAYSTPAFAARRHPTSSASKIDTSTEYLVKFTNGSLQKNPSLYSLQFHHQKVEILSENWALIKLSNKSDVKSLISLLNEDPDIEYIQPNYEIHLLEDYKIQDPLKRAAFIKGIGKHLSSKNLPLLASPTPTDNPAIPSPISSIAGADPLIPQQWGMLDIGMSEVWKKTPANSSFVVAVIDTGVDYTHEDLLPNIWRNPGESGLDTSGKNKETNGIDDDGNGYIDDVIGWDFFSKDNKPYDLTTPWQDILMHGGNPGHGTHCAGNVAAARNNHLGVSGVAPNVKIMALRFISDKGSGTTADAIKAIRYAVDNGAKVLSNSWGSEGEDPAEGAENKALRDSIQYAQDHGVLFIAAAGNGHQGKGYDNDTDNLPSFPATYDHENIISVAALDVSNQLGGFSNWGVKSVDIGAPGVNVFSTVVGNKYSDKVLDVGGFEVSWDGTSMATPHVAGAAALYWSTHPEKTWKEVKNAILTSAKKIPALSRKVVSEGKLDVLELMK